MITPLVKAGILLTLCGITYAAFKQSKQKRRSKRSFVMPVDSYPNPEY
jgi:hypothetical protein